MYLVIEMLNETTFLCEKCANILRGNGSSVALHDIQALYDILINIDY